MKNPFNGLISRLAQMGKKILSLKILQEKRLKLKNKEDWKKSETEYPRTVDNYRRCNTHVIGIPEREERNSRNT